ncbi:GatB/YqeY domain-containing protein [Bacillus sp. NPDC077027]|uniref:GatB/YqeY domain-containing protein n=1 Tax=Bacillus sp. NPDC077027 TaxID=3390548 RepID=UPI003D094A86
MSLLEQLNTDMKLFMKKREKDKLLVIRMVKASLQNEAIKLKRDSLTSDEELTVLSREIKQRKDSLREFSKANRLDLVDKVQKEIDMLDVYLPEQLTNEELQAIVVETIAEIGASTKADMGKVMSAIMPKVKGKADGAVINRLVSEQLSN